MKLSHSVLCSLGDVWKLNFAWRLLYLTDICSICIHISLLHTESWIALEQGKTTADAMGDVWRGLEVVEAATRVGTDMLVRSCE